MEEYHDIEYFGGGRGGGRGSGRGGGRGSGRGGWGARGGVWRGHYGGGYYGGDGGYYGYYGPYYNPYYVGDLVPVPTYPIVPQCINVASYDRCDATRPVRVMIDSRGTGAFDSQKCCTKYM
jgi:hypothetical protein